ncbi:polyhydroxybutyrate depolymerase [Gordonia crocea]|uniref:Polyhydroxybutyrate depolymerase n=2 Tax=Gordonia crocea TaxID=589162 RepID=A0A7I9UZB9_9ACTN|nr:polyhydroxybutyrate depolymerase [Gordonia crocea]
MLAAPRVEAETAAGCSGSANLSASTSVARTVTVNGVERHFRVHLPAGYSKNRATPLILAFHGRGERAAMFERYTQISRLPAIAVYPEGLRSPEGPRSWQSAPYANAKADDVAFTRAILRIVRAQACVDNSRVFAVGRSNGGGLANLLACRLPGQFAAVAMVSAAFYPQGQRGCEHAPPVSRIEFHGTADPIVPYDGTRKFGYPLPAIPQEVGGWVRQAGCQPPVQRRIAAETVRTDWYLCRPLGIMISHVRIDGGTHRWPGSTDAGWRPSNRINAAALIWQFFALQRPGLYGS